MDDQLESAGYVGLVFVSSGLQFLYFAKKGCCCVKAPATHIVWIGILLEAVALVLLPASGVYLAHASILVVLFYIRESQRKCSVLDALACVSLIASSAAAVVCVQPSIEDEGPLAVLDRLFAPEATVFVTGSLLVALVFGCSDVDTVFRCAFPAGLLSGVAALWSKVAARFLVVCTLKESSLSGLLAAVCLAAATWVRSGLMSARLRRGVEVHDTLAVLAGYGSVAAVATTLVGRLILLEPPPRGAPDGVAPALTALALAQLARRRPKEKTLPTVDSAEAQQARAPERPEKKVNRRA